MDYSLYLVSDNKTGDALYEGVLAALEGGCCVVQLRHKGHQARQTYTDAMRLLPLCKKHGAPLIINDRFDIAQAVGACGVHLGQDDLPLHAVRALVGCGLLVGVSCQSLQMAQDAYQMGANYIGVGACFATDTKANAEQLDLDTVEAIARNCPLPTVGIGGITQDTLPALLEAAPSLDGIAVSSGILAAGTAYDIYTQTRALAQLIAKHQGNPILAKT